MAAEIFLKIQNGKRGKKMIEITLSAVHIIIAAVGLVIIYGFMTVVIYRQEKRIDFLNSLVDNYQDICNYDLVKLYKNKCKIMDARIEELEDEVERNSGGGE